MRILQHFLHRWWNCDPVPRGTAGYTLFDHKRNEEILEELEVETVEEEPRKY
jgi:hypothetical protein